MKKATRLGRRRRQRFPEVRQGVDMRDMKVRSIERVQYFKEKPVYWPKKIGATRRTGAPEGATEETCAYRRRPQRRWPVSKSLAVA